MIRRLLPEGIDQFQQYLILLKSTPDASPPTHLLTELSTSESTAASCELESLTFSNRLEAGRYCHGLLQDSALRKLTRDAGLWTWLSLFFFDSVCPSLPSGERRVKDLPRYILEPTNFRTYYRHLLAGPFTIYTANRDDPSRAAALLCGEVSSPGEVVEQIASRIDLVGNRSFVELVTKLYFDPTLGRLKRGSGGAGAGSPRRLAQVQQQLDLTFDFFSLRCDEMLALLPREFDRFK